MAYYYLDEYSVDFDDEEWCEQQAEEGIYVEPLGRRGDGALILDTDDGSIQYVPENVLNDMLHSGIEIKSLMGTTEFEQYYISSFVKGGVFPFAKPEKLAKISLKKEYRKGYSIDPEYFVHDIQMGLYAGRNVLFREYVLGTESFELETANAKEYEHSFMLNAVGDYGCYCLQSEARGRVTSDCNTKFDFDEHTSTPLRWVDMQFLNDEKHPRDMKLGYKTYEPECFGMPVPSQYYEYLRDIRDRGEKQEFLSAIPQELYTNEFAPTLKYYDVEFYK